MENLKLKRISSALLLDSEVQQIEAKVYFAEDELNPVDINIEVEAVGNIDLPLTISSIERLVSVSSKVKCGLREQTLPDQTVREIGSGKLNINIEQSSMQRVLDKMREKLGLDENSVLCPRLHNMLICSRGQFFDMQQDTEKMDNMIATLAIVLPSTHIGGELVIHQGDQKHVFSTENINENRAKCISFYADCLPKVERVKYGYRVALTYDLVLNSTGLVSDACDRRLRNAVQKFFDDEQSEEPQKLVYFLTHEYSEHGLKWGLLKGNDRTNALSILSVAKSLHLVPHLAFAKIHNSFFTSADHYDKNPKAEELLDSETTLSNWIDASNAKLNYDDLDIQDEEICWTKDTDSFQPYKTEHDGYQGNLDFWYRRAAVVLWAESRQLTMKFWIDNRRALNDLLALTRIPGNENQIMDIVCNVGKYLYMKCKDNEGAFITLTEIVLYLHDEDASANMLTNFSRSIVSVSTAESLAKLQNEYGIDWCTRILEKWRNSCNNCDIDKIDYFVQIFLQSKGAIQIAELLLEQQSIVKDVYAPYPNAGPKMRLPERLEKLRQMFKACAIVQNVPILHKFIKLVIASPKKYPFTKLVDFFLKLQDEIGSNYYVHFQPLKSYLIDAVNGELALGKHSNADWSLKVTKISCDCELCPEALRFLNSKTEVKKIWPLREKLRKHVTYQLRGLFLPIDISVEHNCSPLKLIIEKKKSMHKDAHDRYQELERCQKALLDHKF